MKFWFSNKAKKNNYWARKDTSASVRRDDLDFSLNLKYFCHPPASSQRLG